MTTSVEELITQLQNETDSFKRAKLIQYLYREKMISLKEISTYIKKHPSFVSHYLKILNLPEIVFDGYYSKDVSEAHLFILSRLKTTEDILKVYEAILAKELTTAQTEELVRELKFDVITSGEHLTKKEKDELMGEIKKTFFGVQVKIIQTRIKGKIILELKGDTQKTSSFIRTVTDKLTQTIQQTYSEDDMQVLE